MDYQTLLTSPRLLRLPDSTKQFLVSTDASAYAIGAILSQIHGSHEHPVAFASRKLKPAEMNYSVIEKELLALAFAIQRFRCHLFGQRFIVYTDHNPLVHISSLKDSYGRISRWMLFLQEYQFEVQYRPAKFNGNADALSRASTVQAISHPESDEGYQCLLRDVPVPISSSYSRHQHKMFVRDKVVWIRCKHGNKRVIPSYERNRLLAAVHGLGHFGVRKTTALVATSAWWPGYGKDVSAYVRACSVCQRCRPPPTEPIDGLHIRACYPLECVAWDVMGPISSTTSGNKYILVVVDVFSRWTEAYPLPDVKAETIAEALWGNFFARFGPPKRMHSDQGANLNAKVVTKLFDMWGVEKSTTVAYYPQGNGIVERTNRTLQEIVAKKLVGMDPATWDTLLPAATFAYNVTPHAETGVSPHLLFLGREAHVPLVSDSSGEGRNKKNFELFADLVKRNNANMTKEVKTNDFCVHDLVLLKRPDNSSPKKFRLPWIGPFRILEKHGSTNYTLQIDGRKVLVNRNQMKKFIVTRIFKPQTGRVCSVV